MLAIVSISTFVLCIVRPNGLLEMTKSIHVLLTVGNKGLGVMAGLGEVTAPRPLLVTIAAVSTSTAPPDDAAALPDVTAAS